MVLMGIELLLNATGLNLVAFWRFVHPQDYSAQIFVIVLVTAGAVAMGAGPVSMRLAERTRRTRPAPHHPPPPPSHVRCGRGDTP